MNNIMIYVPNFNGGGAERSLINLLDAWNNNNKNKWNPIIIVRNTDGPLSKCVPNWVKVHSMNINRSGLISFVITIYFMILYINKYKPDVFMVYLSYYSAIISKVLSMYKTKLVISMQNPLTQENKLPVLLVKLLSTFVDAYFCISPGIISEMRNKYKLSNKKLYLLPNSVNIDDIKISSSKECKVKQNTITTACRLVKQKRIDILIKAYNILVKKCNVNLLIMGIGPLENDLNILVKQLNLSEKVCFIGFVENPWCYIKNSIAFVLSSEYEGFGNVLIEAMACETPIVSTRAPFGPEYVLNGNCGILVNCNDINQLAEAMYRIINDNSLREEFKTKMKERCKDFDVNKISKLLFQYLELISFKYHSRLLINS